MKAAVGPSGQGANAQEGAGSLQGLRSKAAEVELAAAPIPERCKPAVVMDFAVVTLLTNNEGYPAGALALSASLSVIGSDLRRIAMVTSNVAEGIRDLLTAAAWEVRQVEEIRCNQVLGPSVTPDKYNLGEGVGSNPDAKS